MMLDTKYENYSSQQLWNEAYNFELGFAGREVNIEKAKELYWKAYSKYGNLYAKERYDRLNENTQNLEGSLIGVHNFVPHYSESIQNSISYEENTFDLNIPENELPKVITDQVIQLQTLRSSVNKSLEAANLAKQSADEAAVWEQDEHGFLIFKWKSDNIKATITNLQRAATDLANAQQSAAEAQKFSFENQEKIGHILRYLFSLGVTNAARNRSVVNYLKQELEGMPKSQLNEMARQEIYAVIRQLKAQEDLLNRQDTQEKILREHDERFKQIDYDIKELSEKQSNSLTKEEHNNDLKECVEELEGLKNLISDAEKGLLEKIGKRQTIENAEQEKQAFIDAVEEQKQAIQGFDTKLTENVDAQKKALAEEVQKRDDQLKQLSEEQKQAMQGFDTKLTETAEEQKKALAEEVQKRNDQLKQLSEEQKQAMQGFDTKLTETAEAQKKALAEEVQNRNEQIKQLAEQQEQAIQGFDTKLTETVDAQKKALAEEVQNRNEQIKLLTEQQDQSLQELEQRNNEELGKIDAKYNDDVRSLTNSIEEYKNICYKQECEIEDLKNKLNDLNLLANNKVEKNTAIGIALLAIIALCVAVMPLIH